LGRLLTWMCSRVFFDMLAQLKADGYYVELPESVDALRETLLAGNSETSSSIANVCPPDECSGISKALSVRR